MTKYYKITQGTHFEGHWVEPQFPLTIKANIELNIKHGVAFELTEKEALNEASSPAWGSGIYEEENGKFTCIAENFDSSD
jgi:hypothetical protein